MAKSWSTTALPLLRIIRCSRRLPMCLTTGGAPAIIAARWSWMKPAPATAAGRPRPLHRRFAPTSAQRTLASAGRRSCTTASSGPSTGSAAKIVRARSPLFHAMFMPCPLIFTTSCLYTCDMSGCRYNSQARSSTDERYRAQHRPCQEPPPNV